MSGLYLVLRRLNLLQYLNVFVDEGFETWDDVFHIIEDDLYDLSSQHLSKRLTIRHIRIALNVKRVHRRVCRTVLQP